MSDHRFAVANLRNNESFQKVINEIKDKCELFNDTSPGSNICPQEFDGWSCIPSAKAGQIVSFPCPYFIEGFDKSRFASRECMENGTWYKNPITNQTWSNYTTCVDFEDFQLRTKVNLIFKIGYAVSLIALIISLCIFYRFKALNCTRIQIHKNLFLSLAINNSLWLLWYFFIIVDPVIIQNNGFLCQFLHVMVHYFMVATYFWMFCEGLYLYTLLVVTFLTDTKIIMYMNLIGWGTPAILIILYVVLRSSSSDNETALCWIHESSYSLVLSVPVIISMLANVIFLINIVRLLLRKLPSGPTAGHQPPGITSPPPPPAGRMSKSKRFKRAMSRNNSQEQSSTSKTKKAVRATLILIPLLGLQFILTPFRPDPKTSLEELYQITSAVITSGQGLCVALLFCFCNGEVISVIRRRWSQLIVSRRRSWAPISATTTVSFSRSSIVHNQQQRKQNIQETEVLSPVPLVTIDSNDSIVDTVQV